MITTQDKLKCVERELGFRQRVYDRLIERGKMSKRQADREIELMIAIVDDYQAMAEAERLL
jgi:hypothetical protein